MPECAVEIAPHVGIAEGESFPDYAAEGELGSHTVTIGGVEVTEQQLLDQLFQLISLLPQSARNAQLSSGKSITHITPEQAEIEEQIHFLQQQLSSLPTADSKQNADASKPQNLPLTRPQTAKAEHSKTNEPKVHRSLFSLAQTMNTALTSKANVASPLQQRGQIAQPFTAQPTPLSPSTQLSEKNEQRLRVEEREGGGQQQGKREGREQQQKHKKRQAIFNVHGAKKVRVHGARTPSEKRSEVKEPSTLGGVDNIYIRFMALMARILGQAEAEAHQLYMKIKERTDQVDTLSLLLAKINSAKKEIDWTKDEEMKQLVDKARAIGVDIPNGKYKWSEEEKRLLKENIQMRKDSMEKITQLERTDMQRYLQEASQCHQARSNVLKLLKEVIDTIIHNMRGG